MVSLDRMRVKAHPIGLFRGFSDLNFSRKTKDRLTVFSGTVGIWTNTLSEKARCPFWNIKTKRAPFFCTKKFIAGKRHLSAGFGYQQIGAFFISRIQKGRRNFVKSSGALFAFREEQEESKWWKIKSVKKEWADGQEFQSLSVVLAVPIQR